MRSTYRYIDGEMVLVRQEEGGKAPRHAIIMGFEPFKSPIDGRLIRNHADLAAHNRTHGVTNDMDSLREKTQRRIEASKKPYTGSREERIAAVREAVERHEQRLK